MQEDHQGMVSGQEEEGEYKVRTRWSPHERNGRLGADTHVNNVDLIPIRYTIL